MHLLKQWNLTWLNFTSSDEYPFKLAQNPTQHSFLDHSLQRNWFIRVPKSRCTTNKPGKTNKPLGIKQMSQGEREMWKKEQLSKKKPASGKNAQFQIPDTTPLGFPHVPPSLQSFLFYFYPFSFFLPLPSRPPSLLPSLSPPVLHLHSFLNHISLTNLLNHLDWMRTVWKDQKPLGMVWAMVAAWICFELPTNTKTITPRIGS